MKKRLFPIVALLLLIGCSKDNPISYGDNDNDPILFENALSASTKMIPEDATEFPDNSTIRVMGYQSPTAGTPTDFSSPYMNQVLFIYNKDKSNFASSNATAYWMRGGVHNFYAYYPSDLKINPITSEAPTATLTVLEGTGIEKTQDVMFAKCENTLPYNKKEGNQAVLQLEHKLSKIKFKLQKESVDDPDAILSYVEFTMASNTGTYNLIDGTVKLSGTPVTLSQTIPNYAIPAEKTVELVTNWIVLPGDTIKEIKFTINKKVYVVTGLTVTTTTPGTITTLKIVVKNLEN